MAQTSIASFYTKRKRPALDGIKPDKPLKAAKLHLESEVSLKGRDASAKLTENPSETVIPNKIATLKSQRSVASKVASKTEVQKTLPALIQNQPKDVRRKLFGSSRLGELQAAMEKYNASANKLKELDDKKTSTAVAPIEEPKEANPPSEQPKDRNSPSEQPKDRNPPSTPPRAEDIRKKLLQSPNFKKLKASLDRFSESQVKLRESEKRTEELLKSPKLKSFRSIEIEVPLSPQKSPHKPYLSPKKDVSVKRNLLHLLSPTKNAVALPESPSKQILEATSKPALQLPIKYRFLSEIFRAIDTISQIMHNRKENVTFRKLKPAVDQMLKRNLLEKHIAQITAVFPEAYDLTQEKLRVYGAGIKKEQWELVLKPKAQTLNAEVLLERRRNFHKILLEKTKDYHEEFLKSLEPPMVVSKNSITRWHPEFDLEKVPDIELADIPQPPAEEKLVSGKDVLERARQMFNCNTRMEAALARLEEKRAQEKTSEEPCEVPSALQGVPQSLLEKVRKKQAAKALMSMTRSGDKEKEVQTYSRLPELARLLRNVFVTEKKGVLTLEVVLNKLENSYRTFLPRDEMERHLRLISVHVPAWLIFHNIRNVVYVKLVKSADLSLVLAKLEELAKAKNES